MLLCRSLLMCAMNVGVFWLIWFWSLLCASCELNVNKITLSNYACYSNQVLETERDVVMVPYKFTIKRNFIFKFTNKVDKVPSKCVRLCWGNDVQEIVISSSMCVYICISQSELWNFSFIRNVCCDSDSALPETYESQPNTFCYALPICMWVSLIFFAIVPGSHCAMNPLRMPKCFSICSSLVWRPSHWIFFIATSTHAPNEKNFHFYDPERMPRLTLPTRQLQHKSNKKIYIYNAYENFTSRLLSSAFCGETTFAKAFYILEGFSTMEFHFVDSTLLVMVGRGEREVEKPRMAAHFHFSCVTRRL